MPRSAMGLALIIAGLALPAAVRAEPAASAAPPSARAEPAGRPRVRLNRLVFPEDIQGAPSFIRHLRFVLSRAARHADWGKGRGRRIEYRFSVEELAVTLDGNVLRVRCAAVGELPSGRSA